jgi:hypothetical protein
MESIKEVRYPKKAKNKYKPVDLSVGGVDQMKPKDTSRHPWRKRNDSLVDYSMKRLNKNK